MPEQAAKIRALLQYLQHRHDMFAVLLHGAHAGVVDIDNRAARIGFQPQIDFVGTRAGALNLGFDVDFVGCVLDALDAHTPFRGVGSAALQGSAVEAVEQFALR